MTQNFYRAVKLNKDLGSYLPAFFYTEVSFPFWHGFSAMLNLPMKEQDISVFIHEYIHFLQDISTYAGLNNAYVYSEYIHAAVNKVYNVAPQNNNEFTVPMVIPGNYGNIELNKIVNSVGIGSLEQLDNFFPLKIVEKKIKVKYPNPYVKALTEVYIKGQNGIKQQFGNRAIMESMAYLIEKKITHGAGAAPDFPYSSAEMVVNLTYPEFGSDQLNIIALCDMSMQFSEPGKVFYHSLIDFKKMQFLPSKPEDIIDYFYNNPCIQMGNSINLAIEFTNMAFMVGDRLKEYMKGKEFTPFHNVIHNLLGFAINTRINHRYFFINLVRDGYALNNNTLKNTIRIIGTPIIKDSANDFWLVLPFGIKPENYNIDIFPAILEINKLFENGNDCCEMYDWCQKSPGTTVDERCMFEPWSRCHDQKLCPYALLWRHWNLSQYIPKVTNQNY